MAISAYWHIKTKFNVPWNDAKTIAALQSLWILLQDQMKCNNVKAFPQVSSNKYDTPLLDSSLCRQRLIADGQFSGSLGSCYTSFWHFDTVACLSLLNSCTHATDCAFAALQRAATARCHKRKIHLWKQVKGLLFTTDLSMAETIGKHGCSTTNKKAKSWRDWRSKTAIVRARRSFSSAHKRNLSLFLHLWQEF